MSKLKTLLAVLSFLVPAAFSLAQEKAAPIPPKASLVFTDVSRAREVIGTSNSLHYPGSKYAAQVIVEHRQLFFHIKLTLMIIEQGNINPSSLYIRVMYSHNKSEIFLLENSAMFLAANKLYDYEIDVPSDGAGWHKVELLSSGEYPNGGRPKEFFVLDSKLLQFRL